MLSKKYKSRLGDAGFITFFGNTTGVAYTFGFRLQFDCMLTFTGFTVVLEKLEHFFSNLLLDELGEYYDNEMVFSCYEFYPQKYEFVQDVTSEAHLSEFLSEFYKCLSYYEQEVFPKLLDIKFLALAVYLDPKLRILSNVLEYAELPALLPFTLDVPA